MEGRRGEEMIEKWIHAVHYYDLTVNKRRIGCIRERSAD